jgi:RNA polymerase sigma factor (sigma-70 family)
MELLERAVSRICARLAMRPEEAEELRSWTFCRLLEDDGAVLRKFRGESSLDTYLTVVVHNLARDYRTHTWGRWRPSAAARRMGTVAVQLETLLARDGFRFGEAARMLRDNFGVEAEEADLEGLAGRLPARVPRRFEPLDRVSETAGSGRADADVVHEEAAILARRAGQVVSRALAELDPEDRLLLRMRFIDGLSVTVIARTLGRRQRSLYSRLETLLRRLRKAVEAEGVRWRDLRPVLELPEVDVAVGL